MCAPFCKTSRELWGREAAAAPQAAVDEMRYLITAGMHAHYSQEMAKLEAVYSGCGE